MPDFLSRLRKLEAVVWSYARHYEIRGVLSADDLYQEGLIELDETQKRHPKLCDTVFMQYFKTRMVSRFLKCIRYWTQERRDWRRTLMFQEIEEFIENRQQEPVDYVLPVDDGLIEELAPSAEDEYLREREVEEALHFIAEVKAGLDDEAQWAFDQLLSGDVPDQIKGQFKRVPGHASVTVIGLIFGWDRSYAWRVIQRVRRRARVVINRKRLSGASLLWGTL